MPFVRLLTVFVSSTAVVRVSYIQPALTTTVPTGGDAAGGYPLVLVGTNFGNNTGVIVITVGGLPCPTVANSANHTHVRVFSDMYVAWQ